MRFPFFSIIIPTRGRPEKLAFCLTALTRLEYPRRRFEIIVVDDGSELSNDSTLAPFYGKVNLIYLCQPKAGPAAARNRGAAQARGQYLVFTDDDCAPDPDWLHRLATCFRQTPRHAIGGRTINALPNNPYSTASQLLVSYLYEFFDTHQSQSRFFTSNNLALAADLFWSIGGFDPSFPLAAAEDRELCDRWRYCGLKLTYAPQAIVRHAHAMTLHSYCRQHFNYGSGAYHFHRTRAHRDQNKFRLESNGFYLNLLLYPLKQTPFLPGLLLIILLLVAQAANAAGFGWTWFTHLREHTLTKYGHNPEAAPPAQNATLQARPRFPAKL